MASRPLLGYFHRLHGYESDRGRTGRSCRLVYTHLEHRSRVVAVGLASVPGPTDRNARHHVDAMVLRETDSAARSIVCPVTIYQDIPLGSNGSYCLKRVTAKGVSMDSRAFRRTR